MEILKKDELISYLQTGKPPVHLLSAYRVPRSTLISMAESHKNLALDASKKGLTDGKTAEMIYKTIVQLVQDLEIQKASEDVWDKFCLVTAYYIQVEDEEDDFHSPVGFDDDARVMNCFLDYLGSPLQRIQVE